MQSRSLLPQWDESIAQIEPTIITGMDALGRGHDLSNLTQAIGLIAQLGEQAFSAINVNNLIMRIFTSSQIDATGLVKSPEQMAQEQQYAQQQYAQQAGTDAEAQMAVDANKAQLEQQQGM